uniref:Uncharacterized protein n=1 Tax=Triticum urartu TaxID=4572 RepID=A0A8R7NZX4_TRIUA
MALYDALQSVRVNASMKNELCSFVFQCEHTQILETAHAQLICLRVRPT